MFVAFACAREKKRGKSQSAKVSCAFCFLCVFFGNGFVFFLFSHFFLLLLFLLFLFSLPSLSFLQTPSSFHNNNSPHTGHEDVRNAVNDKTLPFLPPFSANHTTPSFHMPPPFHHNIYCVTGPLWSLTHRVQQ